MAVNSEPSDWGYSENDEEKVPLLVAPHVQPKQPQGRTSALGAVFIVVNAALGAGLLNFPAAFYMAGGVVAGVVLQMCLLIFIITGLVILAYCSQVSNESTYQEVVRAVCGKVLGVICEIAIAVYTFGTCIAFLIIIGDQLDKLISAIAHDADSAVVSHWYTNRKFTITVTSVLIILPLSIPKEISFQKYASTFSVIGTWYVTVIIIIKYIWPDQEISPGIIPTSPISWTAVFNAMPTICFGFQCHVSSVPVFNSMRNATLQPWGGVVTLGMIICLFVYTGTGVCGFLTFGSMVNQDVLLSYPSKDIAVAIARAFIIISVVTSYPILHFCGRAVLEGLWLRFNGTDVDTDVVRERRRRVLCTVIWFCLTLILALTIPDIGRVISLIGGLAACFIFVFPGLCLIEAKLSEHDVRSASWHALVLYGILMVTVGIFILGQTTTNAIYSDIVHH
ncbi:putative sodium-coupled neutral amino acid transporter 7 [Tachysurus fulvidraco]|uniref:putative sodium-coupled neutral amino acid transporter 7 n=1 Tax=Tachysurus fulvidraco TaxID=1234273 RepID=UPI000F4DD159|nr:putative sodium-coupled neutral amino acid transporter 7 [Tachysurus fulvidraco]